MTASLIPFQILGYDHVKAAVKDRASFEAILKAFGFQKIPSGPEHLEKPDSIWGSGEAFFCLYEPSHPLAKPHHDLHGDTVFDLSFLIKSHQSHPDSIEGVGKMRHSLIRERSFQKVAAPKNILRFDHNTVNVEVGQLQPQVDWYMNTFGFEKGQYFHIQGQETALYSWVTRAPNQSVQMPFNEAADHKSQIQEFIDIHRGAGVQHLALYTNNIIETMKAVVKESSHLVKFLDIPDTYYELLPTRVQVKEEISELKKLKILADQDERKGYLLQIFTEVLFGGFFFEVIQREGNEGFGEGNFQALFDSMELDQKRRGVL